MVWVEFLTLYGMSGQEPEDDSEKKVGGTLGSITQLSANGHDAFNRSVELDRTTVAFLPNNSAVTTWYAFDGTDFRVYAAEMDAQLSWGTPIPLSVAGQHAKLPSLDVDDRTNGSVGIMQGFKSFMLQSKDGAETLPTSSLASGINFYSAGPEHAYLKSIGRVNYTYATDEEALSAYELVSSLESISPSLEPSHAFAEAIKIAPKLSKDTVLCINSCGDALKDRDILKKRLGK